MRAFLLILALLSVGGFPACKKLRPEATAVSTNAPEPMKKQTPKERLIGHWINETHRPDGTKCLANDYFFQQDNYTITFRLEPNGRIFRLDWPYRVLHSDEESIIIETAQGGPQSEYTFLGPELLRNRSYDEKRRAWHEEALMHRIDDRTSP